MVTLILLFTLGFTFGAANSIQSRVANTGTKVRYPDALLFSSVLLVAGVYSFAMRAIATTSGLVTVVAYSLGQALGVCVGCRFANSVLFDRFHPHGNGRPQ